MYEYHTPTVFFNHTSVFLRMIKYNTPMLELWFLYSYY